VNNEDNSERNVSNRTAITTLILGILSIVTLFFGVGIILGVIGLIIGIVALKEIKRFKQEGRKMAITGIVCNVIGIIIPILLMTILFAVRYIVH
jgi:uncharacterized BrkB/YihY/UPF0761 family membrane protein